MSGEFWDFLNEKLDPDKSCNHGKPAEVDEFWDYIEPLPSHNQSEPLLRQLDQPRKDDFCHPSNSSKSESETLSLHYEYNLHHCHESQKKTSDVFQRPPIKSDDEFWDFLKGNSIAEELRREFEVCATPQDTPLVNDDKSEIFYSSTGDSAYQSNSTNISFSESGDFENRNVHSSDMYRRNSGMSKIDLKTEIIESNYEPQFISSPKPIRTVEHDSSALNNSESLRKEKSLKISDDEFWDFLNSSSPVVGLNEVLRELPTYLSTALSDKLDDSEVSYPHTLCEESPFGAVSNSSYSTTYSVGIDSTISSDKNPLQQSTNKNIQDNNIKGTERKLEIQTQNHPKTSTTAYNKKSTNESAKVKPLKNKNKIEISKSRSICNSIIQNEKLSIADRSGKANIKLPCISTEFSVPPYPEWLSGTTQKTHTNSSSNKSQQNSVQTVYPKIIKETKFREPFDVNKSSKNRRSLTQSPLGCSKFNITDSVSNSGLAKTDSKISKAQTMQNFEHQTLGPNSNLKTMGQNQTIFYPVTSSTNSDVTSFTKNKDTNTSKNFYLLLPQNQNSHFLVLVNNDKNSSTTSSVPSLNNNLMQISLENKNRLDSSFGYQVNYSQVKVGNSNVQDILNSELLKAKTQITLDKNQMQSSTNNLLNCQTQPTHFQSFQSFSLENSSKGISNKNTSLLLNHNSVNKNIPTSTLSIKDLKSLNLIQNLKPIQTPLSKVNTKPTTVKQASLKPIKSISLGKDKHAIQQTSIPLKMGSIAKDKQLYDPQGNVINYLYYPNNSYLSQNNISYCDTIDLECDKVTSDKDEQKLDSNSSKTSNSHNTTTTATMASDLIKVQDPPLAGAGNTSINVIDHHLQKSIKPQDTNNGHSMKPNVLSNSEAVLLNTNTLISNNCSLANLKPLISASVNNKPANNYVQVKIAPSQQKPAPNLQDKYQPSASMLPVCLVPNTQTAIQPKVQKILVLKGPGQPVLPNASIKRFSSSQKTTSVKKSVMKAKKSGRKTVRELLEERQQNKLSYLGNKPRKDLRVLRPVQKIAPCSTLHVTTFPNKVVIAAAGMNGNAESSLANDVNKRPNILMLPSASKVLKKNIIRDETNDYVPYQKCQQSVDSPDFKISHQGKPNFRPRHYDMSELQIGYFHVDFRCGQFRSKFKVIFSKRQFLYEFPVNQCNQVELKASDVWEQMARIIVPFQIVTSMDMRDRTIHFSVNSTPSTCLGRTRARAGIISNATVYDTPIDSYSPWNDAIRSSFNHKFDGRFITLANSERPQSGMHSSNLSFEGELSPSTLKKSLTKNQKACIRRLPQWDSSEQEEEQGDDDIDILKPQMCSCRISCRSVRCSCAKSAKSCSSVCICINCGNPLNVLESIGIDIEFSLQDRCLFQNIYRIPNLLDFLLREVKLGCCNTFARVQDCIPGTLLCPNIECNVQIEFSWCRVIVCYPERNPRNHCSICGQCCFSNGQHCMACNRCYVKVSSKFPHCPTCRQEKPTTYDGNTFTQIHHQKSSSSSTSTKPEIVILNAYSIPEGATGFESMECATGNAEDYIDDNFQDEEFVREQMDFEVQED